VTLFKLPKALKQVKTRLDAIFRKLGTFSSKSSGHAGSATVVNYMVILRAN